ncbi:unnamed protein product [Gongylonema pulchrum]|uniref:Tenascin n=1 Tax=Gongylonema pulchrum TaxID=637853 RepID=A0A183CZI2_9BILA|nr:unnamed protein product [Gongylonema pulchrum]
MSSFFVAYPIVQLQTFFIILAGAAPSGIIGLSRISTSSQMLRLPGSSDGRCYPAAGLPCDRNVQLSDTEFKSVTSNCGLKGKCVNGRCVEDRCTDVTCTENEICRDGACWSVTDSFCITHFDCGPIFECHENKCVPLKRPLSCNCDPGEVCQQGTCFPDPKCAHVSCSTGSFCVDGTCQTAVGRDCINSACEGGTICVNGRCILDPCTNRCPPDHACREGQCRLLQGLQCHVECPKPYVCVDGRCTKNACFGKSCQIGETCENGICIKVEGRLCSLAVRDCAEHFECFSGTCQDIFQMTGVITDNANNTVL